MTRLELKMPPVIQVLIAAGEDTQPVIVSIPPGATLKQISSNLKDHNLIM